MDKRTESQTSMSVGQRRRLAVYRRISGIIVALLLGLGFFAAGPVTGVVGLQTPIVALAIAVFAIVLLPLNRLRLFPVYAIPMGLIGAFIAYSAIGIGWSPDPEAAQKQVIQFSYAMLPMALACGALSIVRPAMRRFIGWGFLGGVLIGMGLVVYDVQYDAVLHRMIYGTETSFDINNFHRALVGLALLVFPAALVAYRLRQAALAVFFPLGYLGVTFQSTSETALAGVATGILVWFISWHRPRLGGWLVGAAFAVLVLGAVPIAMLLGQSGLIEQEALMLSARHRIELWVYTATQVMEMPLLGHGIEASQATFPRAVEISAILSAGNTMQHQHAHSMFLQVWFELGLVGALLLTAFGLWLVYAASRLDGAARAVSLASFAVAVTMLSVTSFSAWHTWFICSQGLCLFALMVGKGLPPADILLEPARGDAAEYATRDVSSSAAAAEFERDR